MSKPNKEHPGCKDVFKTFLFNNGTTYHGLFEIPGIKPTFKIPNKYISFSKALSTKDYNQWVHFYEYDFLFERIWNNPKKYLKILKRFNGVILPDFSLYRDMPFAMQLWNIFRSRAIGNWLQANGITVIPNIRFADKRTYKLCCEGISKHCVIAIGTLGTIKDVNNREIFIKGLDEVVTYLQPSAIIVYGSAPAKIFDKYRSRGITIVVFEPEITISRKEVV